MRKNDLLFHVARDAGLEFVFSSGQALRYPRHTHVSVFTVTLVRRGTVCLLRGDTPELWPAGSVYVLAPHEPHSPGYPDGFDIVSLCLDKERVYTLPPAALLERCLYYMGCFSGRGLLLPEDAQALAAGVEAVCRLVPGRRPVAAPDRVLADRQVSVFRRIRRFKEEVGLTPHQYIIQSRVREAKRLLADGASIADAALRAGFYDQSHLNRWFNKTLGITPHMYRDSCFPLSG